MDSVRGHLCQEIYGLRCTGVPTARPNVRRDYPDVVYKTEEAKLNAIVEDWDRLAASTWKVGDVNYLMMKHGSSPYA